MRVLRITHMYELEVENFRIHTHELTHKDSYLKTTYNSYKHTDTVVQSQVVNVNLSIIETRQHQQQQR